MPCAGLDDVRRAERVLLHGVTGSGKSTAARAIAAARGLPYHSVDDEIGWLPGWVERGHAEQRALAAAIAAGERWVLDTSYGHWRDAVVDRAQVVVALDYPRWVSLGRLLRRTLRRWARRTPVCNGNVESLRQVVSRDSIVVWHVRSFARKRDEARRMETASDGPPVLRLASPRDLDALLADLG